MERRSAEKTARIEVELAGGWNSRRNGNGDTAPSLLAESNARVTDFGTVLAIGPVPTLKTNAEIFARMMGFLESLGLCA